MTTESRSIESAIQCIRLTLLHSRGLFRASLARLLAGERDLAVAAEWGDPVEALADLVRNPVDVVLLDFAVWPEFVPGAREAGYMGNLLAIAEELDPARCARALSHGLSGVVLSSDSPARLVQAIHVVASGGAWVDQSIIQHLAQGYPIHEDVCLNGLADREQAVLRGIFGGLTNRKIAERIGASEATVKATLQHLFARTGVRTRSQLVRIVLADGSLGAKSAPETRV